jgi:hypothetical protein
MMSLPCITIPSVEVSHFDGTNFVLWKYQMSTYLHEMNPQVWWMVDVGLSHALEDCPQTQAQKKCLYLEAHAANVLSSDLSAEIKDEIEMKYDWPERANLVWKMLEQIYGSSNSKRSSSSAPENIPISSTHFNQDQEEQSSIQKEEKVKSASLGKLEGLVLIEQKLSCLKRKIAPRQVPTTTMMMMPLMMNMIMKSSCYNFKNS